MKIHFYIDFFLPVYIAAVILIALIALYIIGRSWNNRLFHIFMCVIGCIFAIWLPSIFWTAYKDVPNVYSGAALVQEGNRSNWQEIRLIPGKKIQAKRGDDESSLPLRGSTKIGNLEIELIREVRVLKSGDLYKNLTLLPGCEVRIFKEDKKNGRAEVCRKEGVDEIILRFGDEINTPLEGYEDEPDHRISSIQ